jgi:hypothetical protein
MSTDAQQTAVIYLTSPPTKYKGRHRRTWTRRAKGTAVSMTALLAAAFAVGCAGGATPDAPPLDDTPTATSAAAKGVGFGDGQHKVGTEIKPGTYTTKVPGAADDVFAGCGWARLKSFDGDANSLITAGHLAGGAKGRITIKKSDAGVEFDGGCVWTAAK